MSNSKLAQAIAGALDVIDYQREVIHNNVKSIQTTELEQNGTEMIIKEQEKDDNTKEKDDDTIEEDDNTTDVHSYTSKLYKRLAMVCHPDRGPAASVCEMFKSVSKSSSIAELMSFAHKAGVEVDLLENEILIAQNEFADLLLFIKKNADNPIFRWNDMEQKEKEYTLTKLRESSHI
jgi:hypothetical protein